MTKIKYVSEEVIHSMSLLKKSFLVLSLCLQSSIIYAITQHHRVKASDFIQNPNFFKASLSLPVTDRITTVEIPTKKIHTRAKKGSIDGKIEALKLYVPRNPKHLREMTHALSKSGNEYELFRRFTAKISKLPKAEKKGLKIKIVLNQQDLDLIRIGKLQTILSKPHHVVKVNSRSLYRMPPLRKAFFKQLKGFIKRNDRFGIYAKLKQGVDLSLEKDLLPTFAKKMVRKYLVYRGPNCFHAALAFQGQRLTKSPLYNIKEEKGYHRAMINYDELWRTLSTSFYEVDPRRSKLQYGDLLVYFDVPKNLAAYRTTNFRWIRHTATYLFGSYTFSKGSKSSSTPYTIKTLAEEWKTWTGFTKNLGVKVYRKTAVNIKKTPPLDLTDWLY